MAHENVGIPYSELGDLFVLPETRLEVITWTPALHGKRVPGEQVHLMLRVKEGMQFVVRLKSKDAVNRLIAALVDHRDTAMWSTEQEINRKP